MVTVLLALLVATLPAVIDARKREWRTAQLAPIRASQSDGIDAERAATIQCSHSQ
jgi:hypothetical protein